MLSQVVKVNTVAEKSTQLYKLIYKLYKKKYIYAGSWHKLFLWFVGKKIENHYSTKPSMRTWFLSQSRKDKEICYLLLTSDNFLPF